MNQTIHSPLRLQKKMTDQIRDTTKACLGSTFAADARCLRANMLAHRFRCSKVVTSEVGAKTFGWISSIWASQLLIQIHGTILKKVHDIHLNIIGWHASSHWKLQCFKRCFGNPIEYHYSLAPHCVAKECLEDAQEQVWGLISVESWQRHQPNEHSQQSTVLLFGTKGCHVQNTWLSDLEWDGLQLLASWGENFRPWCTFQDFRFFKIVSCQISTYDISYPS